MKLEGRLQDVGLIGLLRSIGALKKTGILTVQSQSDIIAVTFLEGRIVAADALNQPMEEGLGQVLMERGLIDTDRFSALMSEAKGSGQRLATLLMSQGVVDRDEILRSTRLQTYRLLLRLLRWEEGEFNLFVGDEIAFEEGIVPLSIEELLIRSAADLGSEGLLKGPVPNLKDIFEKRSDSRQVRILGRDGDEVVDDPTQVWLTLNEALLLDRIGGDRPGSSLATETGLDPDTVRFAFYQLLEAGLITPGRGFESEIANTGMRAPIRQGTAPALGSPPLAPPLETPEAPVVPSLPAPPPLPSPEAPEASSESARSPADPARSAASSSLSGTGSFPAHEEVPDILDTGSFGAIRPEEVLGPSPAPEISDSLEPVEIPGVPEDVAHEEPEPRPERVRFDLGQALDAWFGRVLALGMLLMLALTVGLPGERNSLLFPYPWQKAQRRDFEDAQRTAQQNKVDAGIRTYYLLFGRFPEQLGILVDLELLQRADLRDPRGRAVEYETAGSTYTLQPSESGIAVPGLERTGDLSEDFVLSPEQVAESRPDRRPLVLLD